MILDSLRFYNDYCTSLTETLAAIAPEELTAIEEAMWKAYQAEQNIFILGNGGSAACATHWVCDFNKGINTENSKRAKLFSLSDNTGIVTALGNDISYGEIFAYQLKNFCRPGDLVIALSVSGNSENLVRGMEYAHSAGCFTAAIIGDYNGKIGSMADVCLHIPSRNYGVVEDIHLVLNHIISQYFREKNQEA